MEIFHCFSGLRFERKDFDSRGRRTRNHFGTMLFLVSAVELKKNWRPKETTPTLRKVAGR